MYFQRSFSTIDSPFQSAFYSHLYLETAWETPCKAFLLKMCCLMFQFKRLQFKRETVLPISNRNSVTKSLFAQIVSIDVILCTIKFWLIPQCNAYQIKVIKSNQIKVIKVSPMGKQMKLHQSCEILHGGHSVSGYCSRNMTVVAWVSQKELYIFSCPGSSIPDLGQWLSNCHFRILTQIVTFKTWDHSDIKSG